jgi:predicted negative regulator of RcsB-dependent stress response
MQPQDATAAWFFKLWPWIETNKNKILGVAGGIVMAIFLFSLFSWWQGQKESEAAGALTQMFMSPDGGRPAGYLKIADDYPGTLAGQRAALQGAAAMFEEGSYADAQTQFQKFLDAHPDNKFSPEAALGVAACLDAQGKTNLAVGAYQRVVNGFSDATAANTAKFALARIYQAQGKFNDALKFYGDVVRFNPNGSLGGEAGQRGMNLMAKSPPPPAATAPEAPFNLSH